MPEEIIETKETITKEEAEKVKEIINASSTEDDKFVNSLPSNNGVEESDGSLEAEEGTATISANINTGAINVNSDNESNLDREMARLLDIKLDDLYKLPKNSSEIPFDEELVKNNLESYGIKEKSVGLAVIDIINEYRRTPDADNINWYEKMPDDLKKLILKQCAIVNNITPMAKKLFSLELIKGLIRDAGIDRLTIDIQSSMAKIFDLKPLMGMLLTEQKTNFEDKLDKVIESIKDAATKNGEDLNEESINKIKLISGVQKAYKDAYTLESFINAINTKKVKVKKFDIEKYKRHCEEFLFKYSKDTSFIINDISVCVPILKRKFPEYEADQLAAFIIGFIKYCKNFDSKNVIDHTFMSYFISNIINLDLAIGTDISEIEFVNVLSSNIDKAIRAINNLEPRDYYAMKMKEEEDFLNTEKVGEETSEEMIGTKVEE